MSRPKNSDTPAAHQIVILRVGEGSFKEGLKILRFTSQDDFFI